MSCIGCGWCCTVCVCFEGQRISELKADETPCPELEWDEEKQRH